MLCAHTCRCNDLYRNVHFEWGVQKCSLHQNDRSYGDPTLYVSYHYNAPNFGSILLDGYGEMGISHTFVLVAVTSFTHWFLSALITPHWKELWS